MLRFVRLGEPADLGAFALHPALAVRALDSGRLTREAPDAHWLAMREDRVVARASLWWTAVAPWPDARLGYIGHYAAADLDAGRAALSHACGELAAHGATQAIGPIDGSTWHAYRLVIDRGELPPFFLEPDNPDDWPAHFAAAGFTTFARYTSALVDHLEAGQPAILAAEQRLVAAGYQFRPLDLNARDRELDRLYDLSLAAFARNLLYTPIGRDEFRAQYAQLLPKVDPRLVMLAERGADLAGYCVTLPDLLEAARTGATRTAIVKTLAVHPNHGGAGLGGVLTDRSQRAAAALGFTRVIHALMLETNASQRISQRYGQTCRRYALFSRRVP